MNPDIQKSLDAAKQSIDYLVNQPVQTNSALIDVVVHLYEAVKLLAERLG